MAHIAITEGGNRCIGFRVLGSCLIGWRDESLQHQYSSLFVRA